MFSFEKIWTIILNVQKPIFFLLLRTVFVCQAVSLQHISGSYPSSSKLRGRHLTHFYIWLSGRQFSQNRLWSSNRLENLDICLDIALCGLLESLHMGCFAVPGQILLIRKYVMAHAEGKYRDICELSSNFLQGITPGCVWRKKWFFFRNCLLLAGSMELLIVGRFSGTATNHLDGPTLNPSSQTLFVAFLGGPPDWPASRSFCCIYLLFCWLLFFLFLFLFDLFQE